MARTHYISRIVSVGLIGALAFASLFLAMAQTSGPFGG